MKKFSIAFILITTGIFTSCNNQPKSLAVNTEKSPPPNPNPNPNQKLTGLENLVEMTATELKQDLYNLKDLDQVTLVFTKDVEFEAGDYSNKMYFHFFDVNMLATHKACGISEMQIIKKYGNKKVTFQTNDKFHFRFAELSKSSSGDYSDVGVDIAAIPEIQNQPEIDRPVQIQCLKGGYSVKLTPFTFSEFKSFIPNSIKLFRAK